MFVYQAFFLLYCICVANALIGTICFYPENYCQVSKNTKKLSNFVLEKKSRMGTGIVKCTMKISWEHPMIPC